MELAFAILPIVFVVFFAVAFGIFGVVTVKVIRQWKKNTSLPRLQVEAKVVSKRTKVTRQRRSRGGPFQDYAVYTEYFVTFQVESGDRMELQLQDWQYALLLEGDEGKLTFQGIRYLDFARH